MQKIIPNLWFDKNAEEAAMFYASIFPNSSVGAVTRFPKEGFDIHHMPEGTAMTVPFTLDGQNFLGLNGGPIFTFNPSTSFILNFDPSKGSQQRERLDALWDKLLHGGKVLMELGSYPFSERYGWVQDTYGLSWQLILSKPDGEPRPFITPSFMFTGAVCGKAEEAIAFYLSVFKNTRRGVTARYAKGAEMGQEGMVLFADFMLEGIWFAAMDSAYEHGFGFTEAISFIVDCEDQEEVDRYWRALIANGGIESMCGWLKDPYGISWQVVPRRLNELLHDPDKQKVGRVMNAMLQMHKLDIAALERAYHGT